MLSFDCVSVEGIICNIVDKVFNHIAEVKLTLAKLTLPGVIRCTKFGVVVYETPYRLVAV